MIDMDIQNDQLDNVIGDDIEELGIDCVERVMVEYKPKVTRRAKVKKVDKLNFRSSFENIREVFD